MSGKANLRLDYHFMAVLAVVVGAVTVALQLIPGFELISFVLSVAALGGLMSATPSMDDQACQPLNSSYKTALEWLLLIVMAAYALIELSRWLPIVGVTTSLNAHWPGLLIATMCLVMGLAALKRELPTQRSA